MRRDIYVHHERKHEWAELYEHLTRMYERVEAGDYRARVEWDNLVFEVNRLNARLAQAHLR